MVRARWRFPEDVLHDVDGGLESLALIGGEGRSVPALHLVGIGERMAEDFLVDRRLLFLDFQSRRGHLGGRSL